MLIFAGAGASCAVNSTKYPSTAEFYQRLPQSLKKDPLFGLVASALGQTAAEPLDVEKILWALSELRETFSKLSDRERWMFHLLDGNRLGKALGAPQFQLPGLMNFGPNVTAASGRLVESINGQVFDLYTELPSLEEIEGNWGYLLRRIEKLERPYDIFTTNYDQVIEQAIVSLEAGLQFGWDFTPLRRELNLRLWRKRITDHTGTGLLTKLHGSVDWSRLEDQVLVGGNPSVRSQSEKHVVLFPGFKGSPTTEPFVTFHDYFEARLRGCDALLFIGFAFRDEHINSLLRRNVPATSTVVVIDPAEQLSEELSLPKDQVAHIREVFTVDSIDAAFSMLDLT